MNLTPAGIAAAPQINRGKPFPGDFAVWVLILVEMTTFALMLIGFSWMRDQDRALFLASQQVLHPLAGLINTLALLSASGCVAQGVVDNRHNRQRRAAWWLNMGMAAALVYVVVKCWEYWQLGSAGYGLDSSLFFMLYFLLTGFHFMHVLLGLLLLLVMSRKLRKAGYGPGNTMGLESGACYWHMVDLVWVVLFPIVYVIR